MTREPTPTTINEDEWQPWSTWRGEVGSPLENVGNFVCLDDAWSAFMNEVSGAKHRGTACYLELRRPDGSVFARCTMHLDAAPRRPI